MTPWVLGYLFVAWAVWYPMARYAGDPASMRLIWRCGLAALAWLPIAMALGLLALYELSGMIWRAILGDQ